MSYGTEDLKNKSTYIIAILFQNGKRKTSKVPNYSARINLNYFSSGEILGALDVLRARWTFAKTCYENC